MKLALRFTSALLLFGAVLSSVNAEHGSFYSGVGFGFATYEGEEVQDVLLLPGQKVEDSGEFYEVFLGMNLTEQLAVELGYASFGEVEDTYYPDPTIFSMIAPNNHETVDYSRVRLEMVYSFPVNNQFKFLVSGGYAYYQVDRLQFGGHDPRQSYTSVEISDEQHSLEIGLGAQWDVTEKVALRGKIANSFSGDYKIQSNSLSLIYSF